MSLWKRSLHRYGIVSSTGSVAVQAMRLAASKSGYDIDSCVGSVNGSKVETPHEYAMQCRRLRWHSRVHGLVRASLGCLEILREATMASVCSRQLGRK